MRILLSIFTLFAGLTLSAQVSVELKLNRSVYMQYEPIFAQVKVRNFSGQALVFGDDDRLHGELLIEAVHGDTRLIVSPRDNQKFSLLGTIIKPGATEEFILPISQLYNINQLGTYRVHAYIKHNMLKDTYRSVGDIKIEVNPGVSIWKKTVGIPDVLRISGDIPEHIKERTYEIRVLVENATKYYYLVLEDSEYVYGVLRIGRELGMENYKIDIDALSRLHILMPITPKLFHYMVIDINGKPVAKRYMKTTQTIPSLVRDDASGQVHVVGGVEAVAGVDYDGGSRE